MLSAYLGIMENNWFDYLQWKQITDEVNFWVPSARLRMRIEPGLLWLLKMSSCLKSSLGLAVSSNPACLRYRWPNMHMGSATVSDIGRLAKSDCRDHRGYVGPTVAHEQP